MEESTELRGHNLNFKSNEYGLCIYPDQLYTLNRMIEKRYQEEIDPIIMTIGHRKNFEKSRAFAFLRRASKRLPVLVVPALPTGFVMMEYGIRKNRIRIYDEDNVPEDSFETTLLPSKVELMKGTNRRTLSLDQSELCKRRQDQLSRFFPVTLERLRFDRKFHRIRDRLAKWRFREWQIEQAACNLVLAERMNRLLEHTPDDSSGMVESMPLEWYYYLIDNFEDTSVLNDNLPSLSFFELKKQIRADSRQLLEYLQVGEEASAISPRTQYELAKRQLLD